MIRPDLVIMSPPSGAPLAGQACRGGGRLGWSERHRGWLGGCRWTGRIVHWCVVGHGLGRELRQCGRVGGKHLGEHVRQVVQQMEPIRHLAGCGRPEAGGFRVRLRPIPNEDVHPGMHLQPPGDGRGFAIGQQGQGPPPREV